jgi:hypothetical protein
MIIIVTLQQNHNTALAGSDEKGSYRLTVSAAKPSYNPTVPIISQYNDEKAWKDGKPTPYDKHAPHEITVKFLVKCEYKDPKRGYEDVTHKANNTTRIIDVREIDPSKESAQETFIKPMTGRKYSNNYRHEEFSQQNAPRLVTLYLIAFQPGYKTINLQIITHINGVLLIASETIEIFVHAYFFNVVIRKGTIDDHTDTFEFSPNRPIKVPEIGHVAWKVDVFPSQLNDFSFSEQQCANCVWGSGPQSALELNNEILQFMKNNLDDRSVQQISVKVPGRLSSDVNQVTNTFKYFFADIRDKNNVISSEADTRVHNVLQKTNNIRQQSSYRYMLPELNCVDQTLDVMSTAQLPVPDATINCRKTFKFRYYYDHGNKSKNKDYRLELSKPSELIKILKEQKYKKYLY